MLVVEIKLNKCELYASKNLKRAAEEAGKELQDHCRTIAIWGMEDSDPLLEVERYCVVEQPKEALHSELSQSHVVSLSNQPRLDAPER
jgi:hypothetical protein